MLFHRKILRSVVSFSHNCDLTLLLSLEVATSCFLVIYLIVYNYSDDLYDRKTYILLSFFYTYVDAHLSLFFFPNFHKMRRYIQLSLLHMKVLIAGLFLVILIKLHFSLGIQNQRKI